MMLFPHKFIHILGIRSPIWQGTEALIKKDVLTGWGIGSFSRVYPSFRPSYYFLFRDAAPMTLHSHNEILETWAELGITGVLLNLGLIISVILYVLKKHKRGNQPADILIYGMAAGIIGLLIQNIFSISLRMPFISFYFWFGMGMCVGIVKYQGPVLNLNLENIFKRWIIFITFSGIILWIMATFIIPHFLGDLYLGKGYIAKKNGNLSKAIYYYDMALDFSPSRPDIYYRRAFILNKIGKERQALRDYLKVEEISPGYAKVYLNLGITYLSLGDLINAAKFLNKAISINPYDGHSHNSLGVVYAKMGNKKKAEEEFRRALSLMPGLKDAEDNLIKLGNNYIP